MTFRQKESTPDRLSRKRRTERRIHECKECRCGIRCAIHWTAGGTGLRGVVESTAGHRRSRSVAYANWCRPFPGVPPMRCCRHRRTIFQRWRFAFDWVLSAHRVCNTGWKGLDPGRISGMLAHAIPRGVLRASTLPLPTMDPNTSFRNVTLFACGFPSSPWREVPWNV